MLAELWKSTHRSVCSLVFLADGKRIASGSGFRVDGGLVTNNHVIQVPRATHVEITFVEDDGHTPFVQRELSIVDFKSRIVDGDPEQGWDYAIFRFDGDEFTDIAPLPLRSADDVNVGREVALIGFQFDQRNLSIHSGLLSSKFKKAGVNYLQLDASVNHGNSGGPLILIETGEVIGVVTRKATGLTEQFEQLIESFRKNVEVLRSAKSMMSLSGVDPVEGLIISQVQMERVAREIYRSANVGVGYAYELVRVRNGVTNLLR